MAYAFACFTDLEVGYQLLEKSFKHLNRVGLELNEKVAGFGIVRDKTTHFREQSIMLTGKIVNAGGPRTNFAKTSMYEGKAS